LASIKVANLSFSYPGGGTTFQNLTGGASLSPGNVLAILGASGSGKSTLLRLLAGLERPQGGKIIVDEADVTRLAAHQRRFAMVFQERSLFPGTVASNLNFSMKLRGVPRRERPAKIAELLNLTGLQEYEHQSIEALSGGQRQRVELARALGMQPSLCLLDEPLGQLDMPLRRALAREIKQWIKRAELRAVYVTHDPVEAGLVCDLLTTMHDGQLTPARRPYEVFSDPINLTEALLTGELNKLDAVIEETNPGSFTVRTEDGQTLRIGGGDIPPTVAVSIGFRPVHSIYLRADLQQGDEMLVVKTILRDISVREGMIALDLIAASSGKELMAYTDPHLVTGQTGDPVQLGVPLQALMVFTAEGKRLRCAEIRVVG